MKDPVPATGLLQILYPPELSINASALQLSGLSPSAKLVHSAAARSLTLSSSLTAQLASGSSLAFQLTGLVNPSTTQKTSPFTLATLDSAGNLIDSDATSATITATPNEIPMVTALAGYCNF